MPYLPQSQKELDDLKKKQAEQGNPVLISTSSSNVITPTENVVAGQPRQASSSGRYTNIQSYLNANQEQAQDLSSKMSDNIKGEADKANQAINSSRNSYQTAVNNGSTQYNAELVNKAVSDPTSVAGNDDELGQITKLRTANYSGPNGINEDSGWATATTQANKAKNYADQSGSEYGRYNLLGEMFGKPSYQQGQKKLDNLLVQNDKSAASKLSNAASYAAPVASRIDDSVNWASEQAKQAKAATDATRTNTVNALSDADKAFQDQINQRVSNLQNNAAKEQSDLTQDLSDDYLTVDTMNRLGLAEGQSLYGLDLNKYLSLSNTQNINKENVATADEYARYAALAKLQGIDPSYLSESTKDMSGKVDPNFTFNSDGFKNDVAASQAQYERDRNTSLMDYDSFIRQYGAALDSRYRENNQVNMKSVEEAIRQADAYKAKFGEGGALPGFMTQAKYQALKDLLSGFNNAHSVNRKITRQG